MDCDGAFPTDATPLVLRLPPRRRPGAGPSQGAATPGPPRPPPRRRPGAGGAVMVVRIGAVEKIADSAGRGHRLAVLEEAARPLVGIIGEGIAAVAAVGAAMMAVAA